jgi:hypothetical protein
MSVPSDPAINRGASDGAPSGAAHAAALAGAHDYRPLIDRAVAALERNTADTRRDVYARIRGILARQLDDGGLAASVVELEKLTLDLAIRKIEREWRAREAPPVEANPPRPRADAPEHTTSAQALSAQTLSPQVLSAQALSAQALSAQAFDARKDLTPARVPDPPASPAPSLSSKLSALRSRLVALASPAPSLSSKLSALRSRLVALAPSAPVGPPLRRALRALASVRASPAIRTALSKVAPPVSPQVLLTRGGLAAMVPIAAVAIFCVYYFGSGPLSQSPAPDATSAERPVMAPTAASLGAEPRSGAVDAVPYRGGPTRVRPIRADFVTTP